MSNMHKPPHPGEVLLDTVLSPHFGTTITKFAKELGISRSALSRLVNGRTAMSYRIATKLAHALGISASSWLQMQANYDKFNALNKGKRGKSFHR